MVYIEPNLCSQTSGNINHHYDAWEDEACNKSSSASNFESKLRHLTFQSHLLRSTVKSAKRYSTRPAMASSRPTVLKLVWCRNSKCRRSLLVAPTATASPHASSIVFFTGLIKLESLNFDSCRIGDEGLISL
ncbi:hypothetical protein K1719_045362 [Acacia pycnantha]|nr:hypothetical protein K1719_045362 [Acacia pycnantha]